MHESLRSIRPSWIAFGWFIAISLTSLILLAMEVVGLVGIDPRGESLWVALALLIGFFISGFFTGTRVAAAPVLHGLGIGFFSFLAWILVNLFLGEPTGGTTWRSLPVETVLGLLLLQAVAAVVGTRLAVRWKRSPVEEF